MFVDKATNISKRTGHIFVVIVVNYPVNKFDPLLEIIFGI